MSETSLIHGDEGGLHNCAVLENEMREKILAFTGQTRNSAG